MPTINVNDAYVLNETGAEVDKVTGLFTKNENATTDEKQMARLNIAAGGSNDNLLDNAYFVGGGSQLGDGVFPINQRGQASYSSYGNSFDRWTFEEWNSTSPSVSLTASGVRIYSTTASGTPCSLGIRQKVKNAANLAGHTLTLSLYVASLSHAYHVFAVSDDLVSIYGDTIISTAGITTLTFTLPQNATTLSIYIGHWGSGSGSGPIDTTIRAVKLEEGTVSTLANDAPPDFGEELRKCKRRFQRIYAGSPYYIFATAALAEAASYAVATLDLPVEMAAKPTLAYGGSFRLWTGTGESPHGINGMTIYDSTTPATNCSRVGLIIYSSDNITADWRYDLQADNNIGTYIDLSCEL